MNYEFLVIDTETTGLDPNINNLLTIAGFYVNTKTKTKELLFDIIVNEGKDFNFDPNSMRINGIDMNHILKNGIDPQEALLQICKAIGKKFGEKKVQLCGHNVDFDVAMLKRLFHLNPRVVSYSPIFNYSSIFDHRVLDTSSIINFLALTGRIEIEKADSKTLFKVANVNLAEKDRHTARGDAEATAQALINLVDKYSL